MVRAPTPQPAPSPSSGLSLPATNDPLPSWPASRPPKPPPPPPGTGESATGKITVGQTVAVASTEVSPSGGQIEYTRPGDPLNGLKVTVPANAYPDKRTFKVSYAPVTGATFKDFKAASPLITVDNGGAYSNEMMKMTVPVKLAPGEFAMGFLYDDKTGKLEGLPLLAMSANSVTVGTYHFSNIFISVIDSILLKKDIDSGFRPGIDDWQFVNRGSYIAPGGHCAGQALTALWYYVNKPDGKAVKLYDYYDNNRLAPATPGIWEDDSYGYRFASVIQKDINWDSFANKLQTDMAGVDDELTFKAFAYSMQLTGEPQEVGLFSSKGGGHDMIGYRIKDNQIYIADPNYPGDNDRRIDFENGKFKPYNSGANKKEIDAGNGKPYETILYIAKTATVDWSLIARRWAEVKNGTIGNDRFPKYTLGYVDKDDKPLPLNNGTVIPLSPVKLGVFEQGFWMRVYRDGQELKPDASGRHTLVPGENKLGFAMYGKVKVRKVVGGVAKDVDEWEYVDFRYVTVRYQAGDISINPDTVTLAPRGLKPFIATVNGKAPGAGVVVWSVDEGAAGGAVNNIGLYTAPSQTGTYHVTAALAADKTKKATATVTVSQVVLNLRPVTTTVAAGGKQAFVAEVTGNPETRVTWKVEESGGGVITPDGAYTAPSAQGTYHVVATSRADGSQTARATVSVIVPTPTPLRFTL
ncbi:MAG: hypothetical protein AAB502_08875, partial [Chloroflexota bacterium]